MGYSRLFFALPVRGAVALLYCNGPKPVALAVSGMPFKSYRATAKSELPLLFTSAEPAATSFKLLKSEGLFSRARVKFKSVLAIAPPEPPVWPVEKSVCR